MEFVVLFKSSFKLGLGEQDTGIKLITAEFYANYGLCTTEFSNSAKMNKGLKVNWAYFVKRASFLGQRDKQITRDRP